ncbi:MAG: NAD(P)/FAD-dependent oxidoreductase [Cyclobacteriaceae bacterium]
MKSRITIIGAGLSGLLIAYRLKTAGFTVQVLEARNRLGGRIHTLLSENETPVEMGATWFEPQHQHLIALLDELKLDSFTQYSTGPIIYEADARSGPQVVQLPESEPSFRIAGGTSLLIRTLAEKLAENEVLLNQPVRHIEFGERIVIKTDDRELETDLVITTLPPALLVNIIDFHPALPDNLVAVANETHTWMGNSIKAGLVYQTPFWQEGQLSGTLFSNVGPLNEFYDHANADNSKYALCGFVGENFAQLTPQLRLEQVNTQLKKAFGSQGVNYLNYEECVWSREEFTRHSNSGDLIPHQNAGHPIFQESWFDNRLFVAGSETSGLYGGYMEGAVYSAANIVEKITSS